MASVKCFSQVLKAQNKATASCSITGFVQEAFYSSELPLTASVELAFVKVNSVGASIGG